MGQAIILDTYAFIYARTGDESILSLLKEASAIFMPAIVIGELRYAFLKGSQTEENNIVLNNYLNQHQVKVLNINGSTAIHYASVPTTK